MKTSSLAAALYLLAPSALVSAQEDIVNNLRSGAALDLDATVTVEKGVVSSTQHERRASAVEELWHAGANTKQRNLATDYCAQTSTVQSLTYSGQAVGSMCSEVVDFAFPIPSYCIISDTAEVKVSLSVRGDINGGSEYMDLAWDRSQCCTDCNEGDNPPSSGCSGYLCGSKFGGNHIIRNNPRYNDGDVSNLSACTCPASGPADNSIYSTYCRPNESGFDLAQCCLPPSDELQCFYECADTWYTVERTYTGAELKTKIDADDEVKVALKASPNIENGGCATYSNGVIYNTTSTTDAYVQVDITNGCDCTTTEPTAKPTTTAPTNDPSITACNVKTELHIVDQTRSTCDKGKVSCKFDFTSSNVDTYINGGLDVKVVEVPEDYHASEAADYFASNGVVDSGFSIDFSTDPGCITYPPAGAGNVNLAVACGVFKLTNKQVCALSEDLDAIIAGEDIKIKFMTLELGPTQSSSSSGGSVRSAKTKRAKGSGGFKRMLQEDDSESDLSVTFPQDFVWEATEDLYPMVLSSLTIWEVDACVLLPPGHELAAVKDANSTDPLPLDGECTQVVVPGEDLVLLFKATSDNLWEGRALAGAPKWKSEEIQGHIQAIQGNSKNGKPQVIDFSTESRGRSKGKGGGN